MIGYEYTVELTDKNTNTDYVVDVEITEFYVAKPNINADNPDDFYGYEEIDFDILDIFTYNVLGDLVKVEALPSDLEENLKYSVEKAVMNEYEEEKVNGSY